MLPFSWVLLLPVILQLLCGIFFLCPPYFIIVFPHNPVFCLFFTLCSWLCSSSPLGYTICVLLTLSQFFISDLELLSYCQTSVANFWYFHMNFPFTGIPNSVCPILNPSPFPAKTVLLEYHILLILQAPNFGIYSRSSLFSYVVICHQV